LFALGEWGPLRVPIEVGSLVEITGGFEPRKGATCIVESIDGRIATVQPVDDTDEWFTPQGDTIELDIGLLLLLPTPTQLRAGKRKLRERHLADKRDEEYKAPESRPGNIRTFTDDRTRRNRATEAD
jgi:hypothetical protein